MTIINIDQENTFLRIKSVENIPPIDFSDRQTGAVTKFFLIPSLNKVNSNVISPCIKTKILNEKMNFTTMNSRLRLMNNLDVFNLQACMFILRPGILYKK